MLQDSTILKNLVEMKRLPVLFIGSGFSKRYLKNYPTWIELLKESCRINRIEWCSIWSSHTKN